MSCCTIKLCNFPSGPTLVPYKWDAYWYWPSSSPSSWCLLLPWQQCCLALWAITPAAPWGSCYRIPLTHYLLPVSLLGSDVCPDPAGPKWYHLAPRTSSLPLSSSFLCHLCFYHMDSTGQANDRAWEHSWVFKSLLLIQMRSWNLLIQKKLKKINM